MSDVDKGEKYRRTVVCTVREGVIDVYDVLQMFGVTCPARQHAIKKLLFAGQRGGKTERQDLDEAAWSVSRAIELHEGGAE